MKKLLRALLTVAVAVAMLPYQVVYADDPPYSDTGYWNDYCTTKGNTSTSACKAYIEYLSSQSESSKNRLDEIEAEREQIAADISKYDAQLKRLQTQIDEMQVKIDEKQAEINEMQGRINDKQAEIDAKQVQIDETQAQVDALEEKVKKRMVASQSTMHFNQYLDILMGASSFQDLLRIASGLISITQYDEKTLNDLEALRLQLSEEKKQLEKAKAELEEAKKKMEEAKQELIEQQNELLLTQAQQQVILEEYQKQYAKLQAESNNISSNIAAISEAMRRLAEAGTLDDVITAAGWTYPVPGAYISAGTWAYPGGALHLGEDFAASVGTAILAAGNGVVLNSANGCPTYGGLGSTCGTQYGGLIGGGNMVTLLVSVNGSLYGMNYCHMMLGSPIAAGTVVTAGMQIGAVGSSGNSSGPHCHIEVYYLGDASNFSAYASSWNGDMGFGTGWYTYARRCDAGAGIPCRIRPESVFGG